MLSAKTRKTLSDINNYNVNNSVALNTDSFLRDVMDVSALLIRTDVYIPLTNSSGDVLYIYNGVVSLQTIMTINGFQPGLYSTVNPIIIKQGNKNTPNVTNISKMLSIFNKRHVFKVSLNSILKDNIENVYTSMCNN